MHLELTPDGQAPKVVWTPLRNGWIELISVDKQELEVFSDKMTSPVPLHPKRMLIVPYDSTIRVAKSTTKYASNGGRRAPASCGDESTNEPEVLSGGY